MPNALSLSILKDLYKELKDNRTVLPAFLDYLAEKVMAGQDLNNVEEFMKAAEQSERFIITFFRKLKKLRRFQLDHPELLEVDMRSKHLVLPALRDFLLWNQGEGAAQSLPVVTQAGPKPLTSGPLAKVPRPPPPLNPQPPPITVPASSSKVMAPAAGLRTTTTPPSLTTAKIQPSQLWKNATLPTPQISGQILVPPSSGSGASIIVQAAATTAESSGMMNSGSASGSSSSLKMPATPSIISQQQQNPLLPSAAKATVPARTSAMMAPNVASTTTPLAAAPLPNANSVSGGAKRVSPQNGSISAAAANRPVKRQMLPAPVPFDVVDLLNSENEDEEDGGGMLPLPPISLPVLPPFVPNVSQQHHQAKNVKHPHSNSSQNSQDHIARDLAMRFGVDVNYAKKTLMEQGNNYNRALHLIQQYRIDLDEARMMDQARLMSENTAAQDKVRAQQERAVKLATTAALTEFAGSELIKLNPKFGHYLAEKEDMLDIVAKERRKSLIKLLEQEKKAIRWYNDSARAYIRSRSKVVQGEVTAEILERELNVLMEALYASASERGAPPVFLAALDAEAGVGQISAGIVRGFSADVPIELS